MMLLEEIYIKRILPGIRVFIVKSHDASVMKWSELARRLGVTPSALKKYMNADLHRYIPKEVYPFMETDLNIIRDAIYRPGLTHSKLNELLLNLWIKWVSKGLICRIIELSSPSISKECMNASKLYGEILINRAIIEVEKAFTIFKNIPSIAKYIPEVSTNIVRLVEIGTNPMKYPVIGFPGRIVAINDEIRVYDRPKVGGSRHMGRVIRKLHILKHNINGLTGVGYNKKLLTAIKSIGYSYIVVRAVSDEELITLIDKPADVVIDTGGYGRVGFIYVTGIDSIEAVNKLNQLIEYSGGI